ncbi:MAG: peptidoglycan -binding protein [Rhizobiales bacterium]|nr:peptidoglycan -binding protein [Hyphomicrobiales bacterium]MBO6700223.1 peptidoglycan -binding protein [Hyphomicrobiales bacterium]MBO6737612.1 peptidoglycan -binding protein [Hyphomicrobiales bacterium]MBO6913331.1 peptidoglycan -binding protein [Hyphomicrobiales bacterium]MBO6955873.1 peptidoglycan -binding protein [Hyphomicrobiales bacterium]
MALSRSRRRSGAVDYWPGFVDAMATLLLVIIFLLSIFMLAQFFLSQEITGRDTVLNRLNAQIAELTELLALERATGQELQSRLATLTASLESAREEQDRLTGLLQTPETEDTSGSIIAGLQNQVDEEQAISREALNQVELLNQQISALRRQIAALEDALDASETRDRESQTRIADLGRRLNVALAQRVQELSQFRSDFFGRLRQILSQRSDIRVVGDRFVFQSEVLFDSGSADINPGGSDELSRLAEAVRELEAAIPEEINWVIRVDGHTDSRPLSGTGLYATNWELSTARATSVVRFLVDQGVAPEHLMAAGFGEFQPIAEGEDDDSLARNRRIEFKLTER